jgi:hypothetical protein
MTMRACTETWRGPQSQAMKDSSYQDARRRQQRRPEATKRLIRAVQANDTGSESLQHTLVQKRAYTRAGWPIRACVLLCCVCWLLCRFYATALLRSEAPVEHILRSMQCTEPSNVPGDGRMWRVAHSAHCVASIPRQVRVELF